MTADLKFALEESNRVCKVPNYFGYTDAKQHAWKTLPTRNDQLLAVLKVHQPEDYGEPEHGTYCTECITGPHGMTERAEYPCRTIRAIQGAS